MDPTLSIADVVADPSLDTRLLCGERGLDRTVLWAHSCEMADPARWLGPHELLMTIGLCIPQGADAQRQFVARLDQAGIAGIAVGDHGLAPRLTKAMRAEAEARGFPILLTGPEVAFASIGRTIAAANADRRTMGVLQLAKLYQVAGQRDPESRRTGADLSDLFGTRLIVTDDATGCVIIGNGLLAPEGLRPHQLRTHRPAHLLIDSDATLDGFALMHLIQIIAVDVNTILQDASESIRAGAAALEDALSGGKDGRAALTAAWGKPVSDYRVVVTASDVEHRVVLTLALAGVAPTALEGDGKTLLAIPGRDRDRVREILEILGLPAGASLEHRDLADLPGAAAEASSEHRLAVARGESWREYSGESVSLLARSRSEAEGIVASVLGPLADDASKFATLRETLFAYLDNDLRWKVTADQLGLHRQTLVYRLDQVEQLTSRSVRRTKDVAEFWLARSAWDLLNAGS